MSFKDLPKEWRNKIILLRILAVSLPIILLFYIWFTLGSLLSVMVG